MKTLITSSTGTIGSRVVQKLKQKGQAEVLEATRSPQMPGQVYFDFNNKQAMFEACQQADKAILITPASPTEMEDGLLFVETAQRAGIKHIIFMSIHQVERAPTIPHFASKIAIQEKIQSSGILWTTIAPNNFYQNDLWFEKSLCDLGIYPQPFGQKGLSRVDANDIADAIVNAALDESFAGQIYSLIGPEALSAQAVCEVYSRFLGKEILYAGDDLQKWSDQNRPFLPDWLLNDWLQMYSFFQEKGLRASAAEYIQQEKILKRPPKSFESFVKETVQKWQENRREM